MLKQIILAGIMTIFLGLLVMSLYKFSESLTKDVK